MDVFTVLTKTDLAEARTRLRIEDAFVKRMGTFNTVRHISVAMICHVPDLDDKNKKLLASHKVRSLLNTMMNENYSVYSRQLDNPMAETP